MKIDIFSMGKTKQSFVKDGEAEYVKRLTSIAKVNIVELDAGSSGEMSEDEVKKRETKLLLSKVSEDKFLIVLDENGKTLSSQEFAELIRSKMNSGISHFSFALGGAFGWDASVKKRAQIVLSLSPMTFTYQMARLVLIEQIYRAMSIVRGMPYHK